MLSGPCYPENIDVQHLYFHEIESTQPYAIEYGDPLLESPNQWAIISADRQTHGVDLHGDQWVSSCPNNFYFTFFCSFPNKVDQLRYGQRQKNLRRSMRVDPLKSS